MLELEGRVAIITGGASGIGRETVLKYVEAGATAVIWDLNADKAEETKKLVGDKVDKVSFMQVNTASYEEVEKAAQAVVDQFGKIDVLVNNAGITADSTLKKMTSEQWQRVIDVNLTGVFNCGKAIALHMIEKNSGRIINTSSVVAHNGNFGQSNYVATKTGVIGLAKVWAKELGRHNICVNAVAPGFIETDMISTVPEKVIDGLKAKTPLGRLGKPSDIANMYVFLASEKAEYVTGTVVNVDGGLTL
jgi:3-oxoacyl-[acyl-carrier protein] reductase